MEKKEIQQVILNNIFKIQSRTFTCQERDLELPLTGLKFRMDYRQLVYLFLELQKAYNIHFTKEDVIDNRFNSVKSITESIYNKIN